MKAMTERMVKMITMKSTTPKSTTKPITKSTMKPMTKPTTKSMKAIMKLITETMMRTMAPIQYWRCIKRRMDLSAHHHGNIFQLKYFFYTRQPNSYYQCQYTCRPRNQQLQKAIPDGE
jgi:hypothetical protein